jgi:hypothetical protein
MQTPEAFDRIDKLKIPISNDQIDFVSNFGNWDLFGLWCLGFGASITLCALRSASGAVSAACFHTDPTNVMAKMEGF